MLFFSPQGGLLCVQLRSEAFGSLPVNFKLFNVAITTPWMSLR